MTNFRILIFANPVTVGSAENNPKNSPNSKNTKKSSSPITPE